MTFRRNVARNIGWNWSGRAIEALVGFFVAPFLIHHLGDTTYGVWTLIAALSSYFGLLDLGVCGSVGRYIAYYKARGDGESANATLNSALLAMSALGLVALAGMGAVVFFFFQIFRDVPVDQIDSARLALLLVGVNLAVMLPSTVFDASFWAYQRFDLMNGIDGANALLRAGLTFYFIGAGHGLVALALITLASTLAGGSVKMVVTFRLDPCLRLGPSRTQWHVVPSLLSYSFWNLMISLGRMGTTRITPFVVGACLSVAKVTPLAIALRLISYTAEILTAARTSLTPLATKLHAEGSQGWQRHLLIEGGKYCMALALFFAVFFVLLGKALVTLWVGSALAIAGELVVIVMFGELLPMSQSATTSVILATARHRVLAWLSLVELCLLIILVVAFIWLPNGLAGVCIAQAVAATLCRGVFQLAYGCRMASLPVRQYLLRAFVPPLMAAALPAAILSLLVMWIPPETWARFILDTGIYGVSYLCACAFLFGPGAVKARINSLVLGKTTEKGQVGMSASASNGSAAFEAEREVNGFVQTTPLRRLAAGLRDCAIALPRWCQYRLRAPRTIVVLGMHRSGTSTITRMVNLCGASLGGPTARANPWNKAGHWESLEGLAVNDLILRLSRGSWDMPPDKYYCDALVRWKMRKFLGRLHRQGTAVWKDPRTVLTFPLWRSLLARPYCLATFRHPLSVARSLQRRDGFDLEKGVDLWRHYNEHLLYLCEKEENVYWIDFDLGPNHIMEVLQRLAKDTGLTFGQEAVDSYTPELRTSDADEEPADEKVSSLYRILQSKVGVGQPVMR